MIFSTKILKTWIIALISKTLEAFSVWIDITTEPKKYVDLRESKIPFSDWSWKILIWLKHILYPNICFWESVTSLTLSQKVQITNAWKGNFGEWCGSNLWKHFASMSFFYPWNCLTILDNWFFFLQVYCDLYIYQQFFYLVCVGIPNISFPLKGLTFTVSLWFVTLCCY